MENQQLTCNSRRKFLAVAVSTVLKETGFDSADKDSLESLTEMLQSLIVEIGQSTRNYTELAGRVQPVLGDVVVALVNMGISLQGLEKYARRDGRHVIPAPQPITAQKQLSILQAGTKNSHPTHIPNYFPALPDPHAYIRTPTYKQPVTEYEAIREKSASQKRDIEKALTKFLAKTSETNSLFDAEDNSMFPRKHPTSTEWL
jgi:transcription initiation factor TFIID subunit 8